MNIPSVLPAQSDIAAQTRQKAKLADAAHEFEASLLQELLKPMQSGKNSWGGEGDGEDGGEDNSFDTIRSFGTEAVAKAISKGGGFGIAKQVVAQVEREHRQNSQNGTPKS